MEDTHRGRGSAGGGKRAIGASTVRHSSSSVDVHRKTHSICSRNAGTQGNTQARCWRMAHVQRSGYMHKHLTRRNWQFYFYNRLPLHLEPVNTICSTMDLIRANLWLSDRTITFLSILYFSNSQRSGRKKRGEKEARTHLLWHITQAWRMQFPNHL